MYAPTYVVSLFEGNTFLGTGILITYQGHVITCQHVIQNATELRVKLPFETPWRYQNDQRFINCDDVALLAPAVPPSSPTPAASLSPTAVQSLHPGDSVDVWGFSSSHHYTSPQLFSCKVTGFSQSTGRIGLDGHVNHGDSGGPVVNGEGHVIGIAQVKDPQREGQAMAIPLSLIISLLPTEVQEMLHVVSSINMLEGNTLAGQFAKIIPPPSTPLGWKTNADSEGDWRSTSPTIETIRSQSSLLQESPKTLFRAMGADEFKVQPGIDLEDLFNKFELSIKLVSDTKADRTLALSLSTQVEAGFKSLAALIASHSEAGEDVESTMKSISKLLLWNSVFRAYALLFSQDPKNIIEVRRLLRKAITTIKKSNNDRDRSVDLLAALAFSYIQENSKTAWQYAEQYTAEAIEIISKQQAKEPDKNSYKLKLAYELKVLSTCRHMKRHPDWNGALADVSQAIKIFREEKDYDGLAHALHQRAWIALANPNRISTDNAIRDCREALGLLASRKDREDRAVILDQLADCLINHTEPPEWTEGMRCMEESVEILLDLKSDIALEKVSDLFDLYIHKPDPEWQKAALLCDIAVRLTPAKDHAIRSFQYYSKARCLLNQGSIDWIEATKASQQGLREARKADSAALLINSLLQLGFICLEQDPPRFNDATGIYTELTQLLVGAKNAELRASALHNLAFSLIHSSRPNVPRAYAACNEAIAILSALPKRSSSEALNLTHLLAADIELMGSDTTPKVAIKHYMEALKLLKSPASRVDRAIVLNHLSFVHYNFEPRDLDSAVKASKSAVRIMQKQWEGSGEQEKKILSENLSNMMGQLASIYAMTTPPQHEKAINLYREALRFMSEPEQYRLRGDTLRLLAYSYWFKSAPSIDQAVLALMEAAECFRKCEATESLKAVLPEIALTLTLQQPPAPEEALAVCRQAEPLLNEDVDIESKIRIVRLIVTCELMRIDPDLENAEEAANHSITLLEKYKASAGQSKSLGLDEELDEARAILKFVQEKRSGSSLALSKQGQAGFHRAGQADSERTDGEL